MIAARTGQDRTKKHTHELSCCCLCSFSSPRVQESPVLRRSNYCFENGPAEGNGVVKKRTRRAVFIPNLNLNRTIFKTIIIRT